MSTMEKTYKGGENIYMKTARCRNYGFTLVELLVVIAIIAVLAAVVVLIINPIELTRRSRDAARLTDLANLQQAINVAVQEATGSGTAGILCIGTTAPCSGKSNDNGGGAATRKSDGTGWVKVNLGVQSVKVPTLPVDSINDATYNYAYQTNAAGDSWEIDAALESDQQKSKMQNDGGNDDNKYEVGSNLTIISP